MVQTVSDFSKYEEVPFTIRTRCACCHTKMDKALFGLPDFPMTELYCSEKPDKSYGIVDQSFHYCAKCGFAQLENVISPALLYGGTYSTRTTTSPSASKAIDVFHEFISEHIAEHRFERIVEFGCNDLFLLTRFEDIANSLIGIDPVLENMSPPEGSKIQVLPEFFEDVDLSTAELKPSVVISSHVLEHMEDPRAVIESLFAQTEEGTDFFFQFPSLDVLVDDAHFDQVHQQHLNYFSVHSFDYLIKSLGGHIVNWSINTFHWGALMVHFRQGKSDTPTKNLPEKISAERIMQQYEVFKADMAACSKRLQGYVGKKIYGFGAAQMLPLLAYHVPELHELEAVIDDAPEKEGLSYINFPIEVRPSSSLESIEELTFVVTAINSKHPCRAVTKRLSDLGARNIILPFSSI